MQLADIANRSAALAVVGIGRVGLPLALSFASKGFKVTGVDRDADHVDRVNRGEVPFIAHGAEELLKEGLQSGHFQATTDTAKSVSEADAVILTVGTPLDVGLRADTSQLERALLEIGPSISPNTLVVTRSTVSPGTTDKLVTPRLQMLTGLVVGENLFIAFCPERIAQGKAVEELRDLPEIVGVTDQTSGQLAAALFETLGESKTIHLTDPLSAELAKLFTNVYRYVNFALANEYALIAEHYARDAHEIIEMLRSGYERAPVPLPGPAGGPCLSKDGYFLIEELAFPDFVLTAWKLNDSVPAHLVQTMRAAFERRGQSLEGRRITVLGRAFKADIDDDRLSPSNRVVSMLERLGAVTVIHDPYLEDIELDDALRGAEGFVLATNHSVYGSIDLTRVAELVAPECVIVDAWAIFDQEEATQAGLQLHTFGRG